MAEFFRAIREPLSPSNGAGLPAHQQILGITIEGDAGGQPGEVRTLVLDLGDLSVRAVDQDTR